MIDAKSLYHFYGSQAGKLARRLVLRRMQLLWPDVRGQSLLGVGFATPYMRRFYQQSVVSLVAMPQAQGVILWPPEGPNCSALVDDAALPYADCSFDRIILVHALENSDTPRILLREIWRVLSENGRILVVVPNRTGLWARGEKSPFGHGRPYSLTQAQMLLRDALFSPERSSHALFVPPRIARPFYRTAEAWERLACRFLQPLAGVLVIEARKEIYGVTPLAVSQPKWGIKKMENT